MQSNFKIYFSEIGALFEYQVVYNFCSNFICYLYFLKRNMVDNQLLSVARQCIHYICFQMEKIIFFTENFI
jgi:hypothetical protein